MQGASLYVQFALFGLATGAVYALLGQGIILIYRGSGIVNFAHGAMAMVGAFIFVHQHVDAGRGFWPSFGFAVVVVAIIGALTHLLVMRPMSGAAPLMRLIATLGVLSGLTAYASLRYGTDAIPVVASLPQDLWHIDWFGMHVTVTADRVYLFVIAAGITAVLTMVFRYTRFGLAVQGAAENERAASALGWSPNLLATVNWTVGAALAAVAGILIVPTTGLQVNTLTLVVIAALAAALVGEFRSFPLTLLGGCAIGVIQNELNLKGADWFGQTGQTGLATSVPFFVILAILLVRGRGLPLRSHVLETWPQAGTAVLRPVPILAALAVVVGGAYTLASGEVIDSFISMATVAVILLSLVVLTGYTGQVSLGQFALAGVGAFTAARLTQDQGFMGLGLPWELTFFLGIAMAALVGAAFGLPALRTRGVNLAVVTLGMGAAVHGIVFNNYKYTGGINGTNLGPRSLFGLDIDSTRHPERYLVFVIFWLLISILAVANVRRGRVGRRMLAVRTNERAAASLGISVFTTKVYAFTLSAGIAGLGGILLVFRNRTAVYDTVFNPFASINALVEVVIGGIGFILGAVFGATFDPGGIGQVILRHVVDEPGFWIAAISSVVLLLLLIRNPDGIAADAVQRTRRILDRRSAPSPVATEPATRVRPERVTPRALEVSSLTLAIGGTRILSEVDLTVRPGEVVGLIGPNGAGKTMFIDTVTGFAKGGRGLVRLDGTSISEWSASRRATSGLARSFQSLELFDDLTVRENLQTACDKRDSWVFATGIFHRSRDELTQAALAAVHEFGLADDLDRRPTELPYGRRRLVAIARAVAMNPSVLLLDEPAAGLSTSESAELAMLIRWLANDWGMAVMLIEHDMSMVIGLCDRIVVLDHGIKIADDVPEAIRRDPAVIAAYLGQRPAEPIAGPAATGSVSTEPVTAEQG